MSNSIISNSYFDSENGDNFTELIKHDINFHPNLNINDLKTNLRTDNLNINNNSNNNSIKKKHDKNSNDCLRKKLKKLVLESSLNFINKKNK